MPLTLVTGPANAEKAGFVLGAYRERLAREPLLVVPTLTDADYYRRELAEGGAVLGLSVLTFRDLMATAAERGARRSPPASSNSVRST